MTDNLIPSSSSATKGDAPHNLRSRKRQNDNKKLTAIGVANTELQRKHRHTL
jgi:hypothetical protein